MGCAVRPFGETPILAEPTGAPSLETTVTVALAAGPLLTTLRLVRNPFRLDRNGMTIDVSGSRSSARTCTLVAEALAMVSCPAMVADELSTTMLPVLPDA